MHILCGIRVLFKSQSERRLSTPESHHSFGTVSHVTFIRPLIGCFFCIPHLVSRVVVFPYPFDCVPRQMEYIVRGSSRQGSFRDFTQSDVFRVFSEAPIGGLLIVRARVGDGACRRYPWFVGMSACVHWHERFTTCPQPPLLSPRSRCAEVIRDPSR